jgi:F-type H+-transporting ATPase subunit alpha
VNGPAIREGALSGALEDLFGAMREAAAEPRLRPTAEEVGVVRSVARGVVRVGGLSGAAVDEVLRFTGGALGIAFNLDPDELGVILLDEERAIEAGDEVRRTGRVFGVPVGRELLGRIVDGTGRPIDEGGPLAASGRRTAEASAPSIMARAPVSRPLQTGVKIVDALVPVGRGQRELILGDRATGKTTLAVDTILNQRGSGTIPVYCAVGQRQSSVAAVVRALREGGMLESSVLVVATGDDPPGLQFVAPYAATAIAEQFVAEGRDVIVVFDDLTRHARAYRELSLLLRRPPGREAYPGDVFYIHARLLERATQLRPEAGGGSLTALPIVETEAQNLSAYIPTNLISITDGQIYLSPTLFRKGVLPAVDVGRSVSRVGGAAQLPAYQSVVSDLRLSYAQFLELEMFSRFATQLDEATRRALVRGRRVREVLKQRPGRPLTPAEQVAVLLAVTGGLFDRVPVERVAEAERRVQRAARESLHELCEQIEAGRRLSDEDRTRLLEAAAGAVADLAADEED